MPCFSNNSTPVLRMLEDKTISVPNSVTLKGAYPNPFNPVTSIQFNVDGDRMHVELNVIDIQGRVVDRLVSNTYDSGDHKVMFDASLLSSGIYFVQLITDQDIKYSKIMLLK